MKIAKAKTILIKPNEHIKDQMQYISDQTGIKNIPDIIRYSLSVTVNNLLNNRFEESKPKGVKDT